MTVDLTAKLSVDRASKAREKLAVLRADPQWQAQHPHPRSSEVVTRLQKRHDELRREFEQQAGGDLSVAGQLLVGQAALLAVRAEQMQQQVLHGRAVKVDDLIRLASECRRALAAVTGQPGAAASPNVKVVKPAETLDQYLARTYPAEPPETDEVL